MDEDIKPEAHFERMILCHILEKDDSINYESEIVKAMSDSEDDDEEEKE